MIKKRSLSSFTTPLNYKSFLEDVKKRIRSAQLKAAMSVNMELIELYWGIGKDLVDRQENEGWGTKLIEKFGKDVQRAFPEIEGFSRSNLFRMRAFYKAYVKVAQAARQIQKGPPIFCLQLPWWHNVILIEKIRDLKERLWYAHEAIKHGWSRAMLEMWIESKLFRRQGKAVNNFKKTLPQPQSDLADQTIKDPYCFSFLTLLPDAKERELEQGLIGHIQKLLLELGQGFAFIGRQYPLEVEGVDYKLDLLFYHAKLHCYVVIELKTTEFKPEYAGKIQFYISAIDKTLKSEDDNPTIGLILCRKRKKLTVEYVLQDVNKPIGVSEYFVKITDSLPKKLKGTLPSIQELEEELEMREDKD
jgi:predicted nuclease of restriction endonuclease-like (RecB) superfamily